MIEVWWMDTGDWGGIFGISLSTMKEIQQNIPEGKYKYYLHIYYYKIWPIICLANWKWRLVFIIINIICIYDINVINIYYIYLHKLFFKCSLNKNIEGNRLTV